MLVWGGQVHIISTHNGAENAFNTLVQDIRAGKLPYSLHRTTFSEAVADGLYERVCLRLGKPATAEGKAEWQADIYRQYGADAAEELDCIPKAGGGTWLSRALIEARAWSSRPAGARVGTARTRLRAVERCAAHRRNARMARPRSRPAARCARPWA